VAGADVLGPFARASLSERTDIGKKMTAAGIYTWIKNSVRVFRYENLGGIQLGQSSLIS
jgi:hypothetical protein